MRRIRYGVALSLDGYIAGPNGEADWIPLDPEVDFAAIWAQFDSLIMGRRTYQAAAKRLGESAFSGITSFVFPHTLKQAENPEVRVISELSSGWVRALKTQNGKDIWLFGGSTLFRAFLDAGYVDSVEVAVIPVLLGDGIPLLAPPYAPTKPQLVSHEVYQSGRWSLDSSRGSLRIGL